MTYSGHDTFHCRLFWLKKGFDYTLTKQKFQDDSGVFLGVGKNMVNSIRFWLKAFGIVNEQNQLSKLFSNLLDDDGWDPYFENEGTLWLLHYKLCAINHSSIYNLIFRELRKLKPEFTKTHFIDLVKEKKTDQSENILSKDFSVFTRTYNDKQNDLKEDSLSGLLSELNLLKEIGKNENKEPLYRIENNSSDSLPIKILLYCILENEAYGNSISFKSLYSDLRGVGNIFVLTPEELENKLIELASLYPNITYSNEAGVKELQIREKPNLIGILEEYYAA
ncbi:DUF4007 family protein [Flagellimonas hymeniacidonis]|uniref:DUF4007 family protein n=1 Tax=Flagellimonas hymeniacidonis TaxID=2603628 RepID=UPI00164EDBBC|nr:DUF4007 family protein [Flagellimonas hymeniacidonis]